MYIMKQSYEAVSNKIQKTCMKQDYTCLHILYIYPQISLIERKTKNREGFLVHTVSSVLGDFFFFSSTGDLS